MKTIYVDNVNNALSVGLEYLVAEGQKMDSRNGPVLVAPCPVTTVYTKPWQRVLFSPLRNANPFFHLMESLWMLDGRNDLAFPQFFNSRFGSYSDDKVTVRGAYGHRWRNWFGYDQLAVIVDELKRDPNSRRCVLAMWDGGEVAYPTNSELISMGGMHGDLLATTVDKPCNTHIYFRVNRGRLDMTVCCRSNDILWGAYGANAVHMSFLQEYMAAAIGCAIGAYYQVSNNFHLYTDVLPEYKALEMAAESRLYNYYTMNMFGGEPWTWGQPTSELKRLVNTPIEQWEHDLHEFMDNPGMDGYIKEPFFLQVANPMYRAWWDRKRTDQNGMLHVNDIKAEDWRVACATWITRADAKKEAALGK